MSFEEVDEDERKAESGVGRYQKAAAIRPGDFEFTYLCEWDTCDDTFTDLLLSMDHLSDHIYKYLKAQTELYVKESPKELVYKCLWRECGAEVNGSMTDFNRHVYFHLFHIRLKSYGQAIIMQRKLEPCLLDAQSRNWLPEFPENLQCGWKNCKIIYDNPILFYEHVNSHCDEFPKGNNSACTCKWTECDVTLKSKHKLRDHMRSHTQEKVCACPTCGGLFASVTKMVDHLRRQADIDAQLYQCSHCSKKFPTERLLRDHMRHHVNHYKCLYCDMTCTTPANLRLHIKYRHTEDKPYRCGHCQHSCKSASDLRRHLEIHSEEENFQCHVSGCQYRVRSYSCLAHHFRKVHQGMPVNKYMCHVCQQTYTRGACLTFHLKVKHKFKWPSGHSRFRYFLDKDGYYRLQTIRYESKDITEGTFQPDTLDPSISHNSVNQADQSDGLILQPMAEDRTLSIPQQVAGDSTLIIPQQLAGASTLIIPQQVAGDSTLLIARRLEGASIIFIPHQIPQQIEGESNESVLHPVEEESTTAVPETAVSNLLTPKALYVSTTDGIVQICPKAVGAGQAVENPAYNLQMLGEVALGDRR